MLFRSEKKTYVGILFCLEMPAMNGPGTAQWVNFKGLIAGIEKSKNLSLCPKTRCDCIFCRNQNLFSEEQSSKGPSTTSEARQNDTNLEKQ